MSVLQCFHPIEPPVLKSASAKNVNGALAEEEAEIRGG